MLNKMKVENLTKRLVILRLNSGKSLFIDPGTTSVEVADAELKDNARIKQLRERRVIAVHRYKEEKQRSSKRPGKESPAPAAAAGPGKEEPEKITNKEDKKQTKLKGGK